MSITAAAITAGASLAGSVYSAYQNRRSQSRLMAESDYYNVKNWYKLNAYNSPSAQMARLRSAGLNPNLIYQNGGATVGAGEIGSPDSNAIGQPDYSSAIQHGVDVFNAQLASDSVQSEIEKRDAEIEEISAKTRNMRIQNKWLDREIRSQMINLGANTDLVRQQKDYYKSLTGLTDVQITLGQQQYQHVNEQISKLRSDRSVNTATIRQLDSLVKQIDANTNLIGQQIQKTILENWINSMELSLKRQAYSNGNNPFEKDLERVSAEIDQLQWSAKKTKRDYKWDPVNRSGQLIRDIAIGVGGAMQLIPASHGHIGFK